MLYIDTYESWDIPGQSVAILDMPRGVTTISLTFYTVRARMGGILRAKCEYYPAKSGVCLNPPCRGLRYRCGFVVRGSEF